MTESESAAIRSSVLPGIMRQTLFKGTLMGGIGVLALLLGAIFIPAPEMKFWGPLLFILSSALIILGLLPYKRLRKLEEKPHKLTVEGQNWVHFSAQNKPLFSVPISNIDHILYIEKPSIYGIGVILKNPHDAQLKGENGFDLVKFQSLSRKKCQCDLFFPYFSQRSFSSLQELLF